MILGLVIRVFSAGEHWLRLGFEPISIDVSVFSRDGLVFIIQSTIGQIIVSYVSCFDWSNASNFGITSLNLKIFIFILRSLLSECSLRLKSRLFAILIPILILLVSDIILHLARFLVDSSIATAEIRVLFSAKSFPFF